MHFPTLRAACALVTLLVAAACAPAAEPRTGGVIVPPPGPEPELLYVCNQNDASISIIDMSTNEVVRTVDFQQLGFSANARPHHVAVEPDGSFWYVTLIGENRIVKLDRLDRVVGQAAFETPGMLALHPGSDALFVARSMTAVNPPQRIGVVRRSDMRIEEIPVFFQRPHALALEPRTSTVYTASLAVNQIAAVNTRTEDVELIDVAGAPHALMQFAISPDGRWLVISGELSHKLFVFDITDRMAPKLTDEIDVGRQPFDPIFTRDGRWVYLGNKAANTVTIIDMNTRRVAKVLQGRGIAQPHGVALSADGTRVYISSNNLAAVHDMSEHAGHNMPAQPAGRGTVVVIDTRSQEIIDVIEVGHNASGIGTRTPRP